MRPGDIVYVLPEWKRGMIVECYSNVGWYNPDVYSPHDMIKVLVAGKIVKRRRINVRTH